MDKSLKLEPKVYVAIAFLGFLNSIVYSIPYIKTVFYDGMLAFTGASNAMLGALMTIYGIGEVVTLGFGGLLAERMDSKKVITVCALITAGGCFILAISPSYIMTAIVWLLLVFSSLFMFWGSLFKSLRLLGSDKVQGKIMGFYYGIAGVGYFLMNFILLYVYEFFGKEDPAEGMRAVFIALGVATVIFGVAAFFALRYAGVYIGEEKTEKVEAPKEPILTQWKALMKNRGVWYFGGTLFTVYSVVVVIQYFTPFFTDVLGVTVVMSGVVAIIRTYGMQAVGSPVGGVIADKIGSSAAVVLVCSALSAVSIFLVLILPDKWITVTVITVILLSAALFNGLNYGVQYAIVSEAMIPRQYTAAAVGFGSSLGFLPDVFQHTMFGVWMDRFGDKAYDYIFIYGVVVSVIGVLLLWSFLRYKKKLQRDIGMTG